MENNIERELRWNLEQAQGGMLNQFQEIQKLQAQVNQFKTLMQDYYAEIAMRKQMEFASPEVVLAWEQRLEELQQRTEQWMRN